MGFSKKSDGETKSTATEWILDEGGCRGDSGSPAFDSAGNLVGIMSRGSPTACVEMVYARLDTESGHGSWLRDAVREAATRAGEAVPAWASADPPTVDPPDAPVVAPPPTTTTTPQAGCGVVSTRPTTSAFSLVGVSALLLLLRARRRARWPS